MPFGVPYSPFGRLYWPRQMLRLKEGMGLLDSSVLDCLKSGYCPWRYHTFKRGADSWCNRKRYTHLAAPSFDSWGRGIQRTTRRQGWAENRLPFLWQGGHGGHAQPGADVSRCTLYYLLILNDTGESRSDVPSHKTIYHILSHPLLSLFSNLVLQQTAAGAARLSWGEVWQRRYSAVQDLLRPVWAGCLTWVAC